MKKTVLINSLLFSILFQFIFISVRSQIRETYSDEVEEKIRQVENNLISWVKLDSSCNWNIYDRMKELHINGVSIAVINNYKIEWARSYGWADSAGKLPVTNATLFQAASVGKSINGLACLKLVQDNKISPDKDINDYLRSWKFPYDTVSHNQKITLAELLSHTAGLSVHGFDGYKWDQPVPSLTSILNGEKPANNPPVRSEFEPGTKVQYSGGGVEITEMLVRDLTDLSYEEFISNNIFNPLGMVNSTYALKPAGNFENRLATAYRFDGSPIGCKYNLYPEKACGAGLWTTSTDLARFIIEIQLSLLNKSNRVLSAAMTERMLTPYLMGTNSALGFFIKNKKDGVYFQHSGLNEGFSSQYYGSMKDGKGVVVLVNSDMTDFKDEVVNSVATVYGWKDFYPYSLKRIRQIPDRITDKYTGKYRFENSAEGPEIIKESGALYLIPPGFSGRWKICFTSERDFFMLGSRWANQQFFTDENDNIKGFYIIGDNYKVVVNKIDLHPEK